MSFLDKLNPEQLETVTLPHQSALVLAGAGSGKTRVLTTRIAYLIQTGMASPHSILAVTFTNKAAKEMVLRISAMLPINLRGMWIGTFHGLCNRLLRTHYREAGLPQLFQILDSQDQHGAVKRVMKALNIDDEKYPPKQVQYFINGNKEQGLRAGQVEAFDDYSRKLQEIYAAYDEQCQREGVTDFAELLLRSYEMLSRDQHLREHYRERFKYILVDEFQDTNRLQYLWLKLIAGPHTAMFAVGDDDQSIYGFRGAHSGNMLDLKKDFEIQKVIKLEQNYRSHGNILDAANGLISNNRQRLGKNLWTSEGAGEPIRLFEAQSDQDEAHFIVDEVQTLASEGVKLSDIALLYRSNAQSRVMEHALFRSGIAYRVYGGLRFFERMEIKHALAYLRMIVNPDDDGSLLRIINFPTRGIGNRSIELLQDVAKAQGISLWRAARSEALSGKSGASVGGFIKLIESMQQACATITLPEQIEHVVVHSGLLQHYENDKQGSDRVENLKELVNAAIAFIEENDEADLNTFLSHASLEAGEHQAEVNQDALQLMTVHAAKGLEFHTVFISGLEEGLFPHDNSFDVADGVEEERRLMYVAITRARRRLYLSHAQMRMLHGQSRYGIASRFIAELPVQTLKKLKQAYSFSSSTFSLPSYAQSKTTPEVVFGQRGLWNIGQNVTHPKFGSGVIVNCEGRGTDARVQVNFRQAGVKWLAVEYAKLTAAS